MRARHHVLVTGPPGAGKTVTLASLLAGLVEDGASSGGAPSQQRLLAARVNLSALTTSADLQAALEACLERRSKGVLVPPGGRRLVAFVDDLNMPARSTFGFTPTNELLKLMADHGIW